VEKMNNYKNVSEKLKIMFLIFLGIFIFLLLPSTFALPVIDNVTLNPSNIWLGENISIYLNCSDNENYTITRVYGNITGPNSYIIPATEFIKINDIYYWNINTLYLDRTGKFDVSIYCSNDNNQTSFYSTNFNISRLTGYINKITSNPAYIEDTIEIDFILKKDDIPISSGVDFNVKFNDQYTPLKLLPAYDPINGWMLKIDSPNITGSFNVKVTASYNRANITNSTSIEIKDKIEFDIVGINKNWVGPNETLLVVVKALERGIPIELNKDNFKIKIGSSDSEITGITQTGSLFNVNLLTPQIIPGKYDLTATLTYKNSSFTRTKQLDYIVPIQGKIVDTNNKGVNVQIKFFLGNVEKLSITTDSNGFYSGSIPPDVYNVKLIFPHSTLYLEGVTLNKFDDPIRYFEFTDLDVPGVRVAGLYVYETVLSFYKANLEMKYDEGNVLNEQELKVFKCSEWNSGRKACFDTWSEVGAFTDTVRNLVNLTSDTLSAFVIGETKKIKVDFNLDKPKYALKDLVKIRGLVQDEDGNIISNATVKVEVKGTSINIKTQSDSNGIFSIEFLSPEYEGNLTLTITADKYPYIGYSSNKNLEIIKNRAISIVFPDTVQIKQGGNLTQEFAIVNTGDRKSVV
jgi:hypothetical protein